jgi:hypothetical protein
VYAASSLAASDPALRELADYAWWMWRDGTIGVCLQRFAPANIVRKTEAVEAMAAALERAAADGPGGVERNKLDAALQAYAAHAGPFGPHERQTSSTRARIYEPALALAARIERGEGRLAAGPSAQPRQLRLDRPAAQLAVRRVHRDALGDEGDAPAARAPKEPRPRGRRGQVAESHAGADHAIDHRVDPEPGPRVDAAFSQATQLALVSEIGHDRSPSAW